MRVLGLVTLVLALGTGGAKLASHADAASTATKLVDRTLRCTTGVHGGARVVFLRAQTAYGQGKALDWLAQVTVAGVGQPVPSKPNYRPTLAGMTTGWPVAPPLTSGGVGFDAVRCKPAGKRAPLSRRGLVGGPAGPFGDEYTCVVPRSLLIRVRAAFRAPVALELKRGYYSADERVLRGQLAVTTLAGEPIVYAEVAEAGGKASLFTSKACG
jgi:hypothetical protein